MANEIEIGFFPRLLIMQILTGQPPFSHLDLDITVAIDVLKGARPVLSSDVVPKAAAFKLIRALLDSCWAEKITHRPDAQTVLDFLKYLQGLFQGPEVVSHFDNSV